MTTKLVHPVVTFSSPVGEKNVMTSQNIAVADAKGRHSIIFVTSAAGSNKVDCKGE